MSSGPGILLALALLIATAPAWLVVVSFLAVLLAIAIGLICPHGPIGR